MGNEMILEILSYAFMQRALIAGIMLSIICPLIGIFLVLRRMSMLSDGLGHAAFGGIALGLLLKIQPLLSSLIITPLAALGIQRMVTKTKVYGDSAISLVQTLGVGSAIIIIGIVRGFNSDLFSYLFGSILAISEFDLIVISLILILVMSFISLFYKKLVFMCFNEEMAKTSGVNVDLINTLFAIFTAMAIVVSIRAVGVLLVSALVVIPSLIAIQIGKSFKNSVILSIAVSIASVILGTFMSFYLNVPTGGTIAVLLCLFFLLSIIFRK